MTAQNKAHKAALVEEGAGAGGLQSLGQLRLAQSRPRQPEAQ